MMKILLLMKTKLMTTVMSMRSRESLSNLLGEASQEGLHLGEHQEVLRGLQHETHPEGE